MSDEERFPAGADLVEQGKCPRGLHIAMGCMFCAYGHMTECYYQMTCEEADCEHYRAERLHESEEEIWP